MITKLNEQELTKIAHACCAKELATYGKPIARFFRESDETGKLIDTLPEIDTITVSHFLLKNATQKTLRATLLLLGIDTEFKGTYNWKEGDTLYGYCRYRGGRYEVSVSTTEAFDEFIPEITE